MYASVSNQFGDPERTINNDGNNSKKKKTHFLKKRSIPGLTGFEEGRRRVYVFPHKQRTDDEVSDQRVPVPSVVSAPRFPVPAPRWCPQSPGCEPESVHETSGRARSCKCFLWPATMADVSGTSAGNCCFEVGATTKPATPIGPANTLPGETQI